MSRILPSSSTSLNSLENKARLQRLWNAIERRRKVQLAALLTLTFIASITEVVSIGAVLPFLAVLTAPERVFAHELIWPLATWWGIVHPSELLLPLTVVFCGAAFAAALVRGLAVWARTRLSFAIGADISLEIYRRTLHQPYAVHISRNSSEVIDGLTSKVSAVIYSALNPAIVMLTNTLMILIILSALLAYQPELAVMAFSGFGGLYLIIYFASRTQLEANSRQAATSSTRRIKFLQEGLGGIRDVLLDRTQVFYCTEYHKADREFLKALAENAVAGETPRFAIEALGMITIALLAFHLAREPEGFEIALPLVGALAITAQRLLPLLQQMYYSAASYSGNAQALEDALLLLEQPMAEESVNNTVHSLTFRRTIEFRNVKFDYGAGTPTVLQQLNLTIPKGSRTGFFGTTGSGKSTLLDVMMGLLEPTEGDLLVDGVPVNVANRHAWHRQIAHVPQSLYLSDQSIAENIAFGMPRGQIDMARVRMAAQRAQIAETIEGWPEQFETMVGERGMKLSGGERQRIGIARALYKQADVLLFDEATSALDGDTEIAVIKALEGLDRDLTILMVAHRLTTLRGCDQIIELDGGRVRRVGTYKALFEAQF